jgi:hypothetical protein
VLSVDRLSVGAYVIKFASGTWAEPPTCTAIGGTTPQVAFARIGAAPTTTSVTLQFSTTNGGIVDQFVNVTCMGPCR